MDTYTRSSLDPKKSTNPTQGSIPFSAIQSLGLFLPFQCYSGGVKKKANPLALSVRLLHRLGLSSKLRPHFHSKDSPKTNNHIHTTITTLGLKGEHCQDQNRVGKMGKNNSDYASRFPESLMALTWLKRLKSSRNSWIG